MEHLLNFFDLYEKLIVLFPGRDHLVITLAIIAAAIGAYFKWLRNLHVRYKFPFILSIMVFTIALNLLCSSLLKNFLWVRATISILTIIIIITLFYSIKHPLPLSAIRLRKCEAVIKKREVLEAGSAKLFEKKPWYILTTAERFQFTCLCYQFYFNINDYKNAYLSLATIKENDLFYEEKKKFYLMQMNSFALLGALSKADAIYARINEKDLDTECFLVKSMVEEYKGDMVASFEYLQKALDCYSATTSVSAQTVLFNNLGRMYRIKNNLTEAVYYYRKSLQLSLKENLEDIQHVAYQNLIATLYANDVDPKGKSEAERYFNEYTKDFGKSTVLDMLEIEAFQLNFSRQYKNVEEVTSVIEAGYKKLKEKAIKESPEMLCNILASNFRLYTDHKMNPAEIMDDIRNNWEQFFRLKMPERYFFLKEIHMGMKLFNPNGFGSQYQNELREVNEYMISQAFDDITEILNKTNEHEIHFRAMLMKERAGCVKEFVKPYNFNHVYQLLQETVDVYESNGLITEAVNIRLDIADECFAIYNMKGGKTKYADVMNDQVNLAIQRLETFKKHPAAAEMELRIAAYCLALERKIDAKLYFERFLKKRVSPLHFKDWMRMYFAVLVQEFPELLGESV